MVSNHSSHLDSSALIAALYRGGVSRVYSLGARDYFWPNPLLRWFVTRCMSVLPISRKGITQRDIHVMLKIKDRAIRGGYRAAIVMFPEGTRSRSSNANDDDVGDFKFGVGFLSARLNVPVVPAHIRGTRAALPKHRIVPIRHPIRVRFGPPWAPNPAAAPPAEGGSPDGLYTPSSAFSSSRWKEEAKRYAAGLRYHVVRLAAAEHTFVYDERALAANVGRVPDRPDGSLLPLWDQVTWSIVWHRLRSMATFDMDQPWYSSVMVVLLTLFTYAVRLVGDVWREGWIVIRRRRG